ncbi:hypothetical protein D3C87_1395970 [compost metagenome]
MGTYDRIVFQVSPTQLPGTVPLYRFRQASTGDRTLHTYSAYGATTGYVNEGHVGYVAYPNPVGHLNQSIWVLKKVGEPTHYYTESETEKNAMINSGQWGWEGNIGYAGAW